MIHIQKVILATGIEMFENNYFSQNTDNTWTMWIKWNWSPSNKLEYYAPVVSVFNKLQPDSTHKIAGEEIYFRLNEHDRGFDFETFIKRFVNIERI